MRPETILDLDPIIHAPIRLAVMSALGAVEGADFTFLKESIGVTDGNLSTHLAKLESIGYIVIRKTFQGKKPKTTCSITKKGRKAFLDYLDGLERIVRDQKTQS
jgi:DNA-binding HxlR family transcriptional regulator